jgi:tetratricopeptide (TPR) repeat protein
LLLLLLVAVVQGGPTVRPEHDLAAYLELARGYEAGERTAALREVRRWRSAEVRAADEALRAQEGRLRAKPLLAGEIDFRRVEAAVLLHAETGLLFLAGAAFVDATFHLEVSRSLFEWSHGAAQRLRARAEAARSSPSLLPRPEALEVEERIRPRDYHVAVASAALAYGSPEAALPAAADAVRAAPREAEVQLLDGCVEASLAENLVLQRRVDEAQGALEQAERAFRRALAIDGKLHEARLRLGKLLLEDGRAHEAHALLAFVADHATDQRLLYLAHLFLGRAAERRGRWQEAQRAYETAAQAWPDAQAARLGLARARERTAGPGEARELVAATLADSRRPGRAPDPWWTLPFGPPALATSAVERVFGAGARP